MKERWIWPFELLEKIGEGGMGVVYRARYVKNDREVAVKLLSPEITDDTILARFEREMEILKSLRHPNIVYCFGGKCEEDQRFYAMELVDGGSLRTLLKKRGRLSGDQTIELAVQICAALTYAHERGVIHRDIKPSNFLLTSAGRLKLSDFGLATIIAGHKLTAAGRTVGTFHYMAPEQVRGKPPPSPQTDLYALGCVLFELLAGRPPFVGQATAEILQQHVIEPAPRVSTLSMAAPAELDNLIAQLLEKDVENRPNSAAEVARELTTVRTSVSVIERSAKKALAAADIKSAESERRADGLKKGLLYWPLVLCAVLILALLLWNRSLSRRAGAFGRSEALWLEAYHHKDRDVRMAAARALGEMGADSPAAIAALIQGLNDSDAKVRSETAGALGRVGAAAKPAIPFLLKVQNTDDRPNVREAADEALTRIRASETGSSSWPWVLAALLTMSVIGCLLVRRKLPSAHNS